MADSTNHAKPNISAGRKLVAWCILVAAITGTALFKYETASRPTLLAGPMVQMPATDRVLIQWEATTPFGTATVNVRAAGEPVAHAYQVTPTNGRFQLQLDHLPPNTKHQYSIKIRGLLKRAALSSGPHTFRTPPGRRTPIRFLAFGDSGVGTHTQAMLAKRMQACTPDFIIHTGDLIYPTGARDDYRPNFYTPYRNLLPSAFFMPCLGNHDVITEQGQPLLDEFTLPANGPDHIPTERNYFFDYGPARFVAVDTNLKEPDGAITHEEMKSKVAPWLRDALSNCDAKWKFVYFHHPFYTNSSHAAEGATYIKEAFAEIFETCHVDIVFNGHNHLYERTAPLRRDEIIDEKEIGLSNLQLDGSALFLRDPTMDSSPSDPTIHPLPAAPQGDDIDQVADTSASLRVAPPDGRHGVVYIVTGAGGAYRYPENPERPKYIRTYNDAVFSFTDIELRPNVCWVRQIDEQGQAIDRFVIRKGTDIVPPSN